MFPSSALTDRFQLKPTVLNPPNSYVLHLLCSFFSPFLSSFGSSSFGAVLPGHGQSHGPVPSLAPARGGKVHGDLKPALTEGSSSAPGGSLLRYHLLLQEGPALAVRPFLSGWVLDGLTQHTRSLCTRRHPEASSLASLPSRGARSCGRWWEGSCGRWCEGSCGRWCEGLLLSQKTWASKSSGASLLAPLPQPWARAPRNPLLAPLPASSAETHADSSGPAAAALGSRAELGSFPGTWLPADTPHLPSAGALL